MILLDLFCGAGGSAVGYHRAGFSIVGVDHLPQKNYPFPFVQMDAIDFLMKEGRYFDMIHASTPCQAYSVMRSMAVPKNAKPVKRIELPIVRTALESIGKPFVIENVPGASMRADVVLCGTMFGLRCIRHRWFELGNFDPMPLILTPPCDHWGTVKDGDFFTVCGHGAKGKRSADTGYTTPFCSKENAALALGIDWMYKYEMTQAIPPAYTEFIGKEILDRDLLNL